MSNEVPYFLTSSSTLLRAAATHYNDEGYKEDITQYCVCNRVSCLQLQQRACEFQSLAPFLHIPQSTGQSSGSCCMQEAIEKISGKS